MSELFSFGAWVRRRRRALDLTREELAPCLGCSVVTIRRIEADARRPSKQLAARLADSLEIAAEGQATRSVRLQGASAALVEAIGAALPLTASPRFSQILQTSRQTLTDDQQTRAEAEGRAMTVEQAIALVSGRRFGDGIAPPPSHPSLE